MKRKTASRVDRLSRWVLSLMGLSVAVLPSGARAADDESTTDESEAKPALSPEEMFEGGANTYNNWVEFGVGNYFTSGNQAQFQQLNRTRNDLFGGIEDFHYQRDLGKDVMFKMDGHALFDNHDYKLRLDLRKSEVGYLKIGYDQFRTWYNADGGYYDSPNAVMPNFYAFSDDALALDRGECFAEIGLNLENIPKIKFRYTHRYRDGQKSSTSWGAVRPDSVQFNRSRGLVPSFYDIDEKIDIFELSVNHQIKATALGVGVRYETGDLNNSRVISQYPGQIGSDTITDKQGTKYDYLSANAFTETWIKENLFFSTGFLFADVDNDYSGGRSAMSSLGYSGLNGGSRMQEYVLNLNLMAKPWKHVSIVPSVRAMKQDWDADAGLPGSIAANSNGDALDVRERLEVRCDGVTNWVFYVRGEWTQGEGNLTESGGITRTGLPDAGLQRETDDSRRYQKYLAGINWYPARQVSLDLRGYHQIHDYDYDHLSDSTSNLRTSGNRYPAYLKTQSIVTDNASVRVRWRPLNNVTLVGRYEFQLNTYDTKADFLDSLETSKTTSHIIAANVSWVPWSRLYIQAGGNYVLSDTTSPASDQVQSVLDAENNYWTVNATAGFVLDDKTDLHAGYFYYQSDNYVNNSDNSVSYGVGGREHGITCGITRRLRENIRLNLRYGFSSYRDDDSGGNLAYDSHLVYGSIQYRF